MTAAEEIQRARLWAYNQRDIAAGRLRAAAALSAPRANKLALEARWAPLVGVRATTGSVDSREPLILTGEVPSVVVLQGPPGATGPAGPPGPAGSAGGQPFIFAQGSPATVWTIPHNLGKLTPDVTVYTAGGTMIETPEAYALSGNVLELRFSTPFSGTAHIT